MKPIFATILALALCLAPAAFAHNGNGGPGTTTSTSPNFQCWQTQNPHDYTMDPSTRTDWMARESTNAAWIVWVGDHNMDDCDGDGEGFDYDGDMEYGFGGGRFTINDPDYDCHPPQEVGHHSKTFTVVDDVWPTVSFTVGADPSPYEKIPIADPETGDIYYLCLDDGGITPSTDADDWLYDCTDACTVPWAVWNAGTLRVTNPGPGGELWVFINIALTAGDICREGPFIVSFDPLETCELNPNFPNPIRTDMATTGHIWS